MKLYAEASAVLSWLLGEPDGAQVAERITAAERVITSDLTILECERALIRCVAVERLSEASAAERRLALEQEIRGWNLLRMDEAAFDRARRPFPVEPVRTLDALHLALALTARAALPDLEVLTLDQRVRENAIALGLVVTPAAGE